MIQLYCLGEMREKEISHFQENGFSILCFDDASALLKQARMVYGVYFLIEDRYFEDYLKYKEELQSTFIYSYHVRCSNGYEWLRQGAKDYIEILTDNFVETVKFHLKKKNANRGGFINKIFNESNQLYFSIVENAPVLVLLVDQAGHLLYTNKEAQKILCVQDSIEDFHYYLDAVLAEDFVGHLRNATKNYTLSEGYCPIVQEGKVTPIQWYYIGFHNIVKDVALVFGLDVTDNMQMRQQNTSLTKFLLNLNQQLERTNQYLDQFTRMVSHDIKNGLSRIMGFSRLLTKELEHHELMDAKVLSNRIFHNVEDMTAMVERMLEFSKSRGSNLILRKFLLGSLLKDILDSLQMQFMDVNGSFELDSSEAEIETDMICLKQVFENIILNAIKYRSPNRALRLSISVQDMGADILISFKDNGIGIKLGDEEKIFQEFFREDGVANHVSGYGIGLFTVKSLLDSLQGSIWVQANLDFGCTFYIQLAKGH